MADKNVDVAVEAHTAQGGLYQKEAKVYPRSVKGRFASLRNLAMYVLLGLFYFVPWIQWSGRQAVLFDLPARKFHIFGLTLWPQDFIYLALLLVIAAVALFFFTALAGRLWCGYACPQTVWTEAFLLMERWVEGDRLKRLKLDRSPWNANKIVRKGFKQFLWIIFSLWTGFTFVGFFTPIRELAVKVMQAGLGPWELFWILFYGFATYGNAGFLREQVCKYMCPYARFQSAMFDRDTLIISYDEKRGEARGSRKRGTDPKEKGLGDCIDCTLCVQVCPTGIDIRDGLQYECIACAACIDVCDQVMEKMEYPKGLIRYTTENSLTGEKTRIFRPRIVIYMLVLSVLCIGLLFSVLSRTPLRMEVVRDRNALYREVGNEQVENVYTLRVINMTDEEQAYVLSIGADVELNIQTGTRFQIAAGSSAAEILRLRADKNQQQGIASVTVTVTQEDDPRVSIDRNTKFFFPSR